MNLKRLQAFHAVIDAGSVTAAAERLHMTQPAVSRLIGDLERELGLALFLRERQRLVPTSEGRAFFRETERALAAVDQIVDIARDIRTLKGAHLRIVAPMIAAFGFLPTAIARLAVTYPRARFSLEIRDVRDIADWVTTGPFDLGITIMPLDDVRVEYKHLATIRCVLVMPGSHRLAEKNAVSVKDLAEERMILPSPGNINRDRIAAVFASAKVRYDGAVDTPSAFSACQLAAQGLGLAIVDPGTFRSAGGLGLVARPIRPSIEFSIGCFFPANRPRSSLVNAFVTALRSTICEVKARTDC